MQENPHKKKKNSIAILSSAMNVEPLRYTGLLSDIYLLMRVNELAWLCCESGITAQLTLEETFMTSMHKCEGCEETI